MVDTDAHAVAPRPETPELLAESPPTFLGIAGCDLLALEGLAYGEQLAAAGVAVESKTYAGGTHSVLILAG